MYQLFTIESNRNIKIYNYIINNTIIDNLILYYRKNYRLKQNIFCNGMIVETPISKLGDL